MAVVRVPLLFTLGKEGRRHFMKEASGVSDGSTVLTWKRKTLRFPREFLFQTGLLLFSQSLGWSPKSHQMWTRTTSGPPSLGGESHLEKRSCWTWTRTRTGTPGLRRSSKASTSSSGASRSCLGIISRRRDAIRSCIIWKSIPRRRTIWWRKGLVESLLPVSKTVYWNIIREWFEEIFSELVSPVWLIHPGSMVCFLLDGAE